MARVASVSRLQKALRERNFQEDEISQIVFDARRGSQCKRRRISLHALKLSLWSGHGLSEDHAWIVIHEACNEPPDEPPVFMTIGRLEA